MINYSLSTLDTRTNEFGLDEENIGNDVRNSTHNRSFDKIMFDNPNDPVSDDVDILNKNKSDFYGIRLVDHIPPSLRHSYF